MNGRYIRRLLDYRDDINIGSRYYTVKYHTPEHLGNSPLNQATKQPKIPPTPADDNKQEQRELPHLRKKTKSSHHRISKPAIIRITYTKPPGSSRWDHKHVIEKYISHQVIVRCDRGNHSITGTRVHYFPSCRYPVPSDWFVGYVREGI